MTSQRPRIRKEKRAPSHKGKGPDGNRITIPWGRGASDYRPGLFTKRYLEDHGEACCADVFRALKEDLGRINKDRVDIGERPIRGGTYNSFAKYWHWFKLLSLIEPVDRAEPSIYGFLEEKIFYQLTSQGASEEAAWLDPVRAAHPEFG